MAITSLSLPGLRPLVFQCGACKSILSDSLEFVCMLTTLGSDPLRCIAVKGISDARIDRISHTIVEVSGERSTHFTLCCAGCGGPVGRLYSEVPPALAAVQNMFCLEVDRCLTYELGTAEMRPPGTAASKATPQQQQQGQVDVGVSGSAQTDAGLVVELLARIEHLEAKLCTLQGIQLLHDSQLRALPGYQAEAQYFPAAAGVS